MNGSLKTCLLLQATARAPQNESRSTAHCAPPAHRVPLILSNPVLSSRARRSPVAPRLSPRSNAPLALSTTTPGKPGSLPLPRHPHFLHLRVQPPSQGNQPTRRSLQNTSLVCRSSQQRQEGWEQGGAERGLCRIGEDHVPVPPPYPCMLTAKVLLGRFGSRVKQVEV